MVSDLTKSYENLARQQLSDIEKIVAGEQVRVGLIKDAIEIRSQEAGALDHEVELLKILGAEQQKIDAAKHQALVKRVEAARLEGDEEESLKTTRELELEIARQTVEAAKRHAAAIAKSQNEAEKLRGEMKTIVQRAKDFGNSMDRALSKGAQLGQTLFGFQAIGGALGDVKQLLDESSATMIRNTNLSQGLEIGITGARAAFGGMINDADLAAKANEAFLLGAVSSSQEFTAVSAGIAALAQKQGKDVNSLLDSGVSALARQSPLLFDNLGLTLSNADAQEIYAKSLGKTVKQLTAQEKSVAFTKAGIIKLTEAAKAHGKTTEDLARRYAQTAVAMENFRGRALGMDDTMGRAREALRNMTDEQLRYLENAKYRGADVDDINEALRESAELQAQQTNEMLGTNLAAGAFLVKYQDIKKLGDAEVVVERERARRRQVALDGEAKQAEEQRKEKIKGLLEEADGVDHIAALVEASGGKQKDVNSHLREAIALRMEAASLASDETEKTAEQLKLQRQLDLMAAKELAPKKRGGGTTRADRVGAEGESGVAALEQRAEVAKLLAKTEAELAVAEGMANEAARARLKLDLEVINVTRAKNSVERIELQNSKEAIARELEMIDIRQRSADRVAAAEEEARWREEGLASAKAQATADANESARVIELDKHRTAAASKRQEESRWSASLKANEIQLIDAEIAANSSAYETKLLQIQQQQAATEAELDARARMLALDDPETEAERIEWRDAARQLEHDREMARLEAAEGRKQAYAEADQARADAEIKRRKAVFDRSVKISQSSNSLLEKGGEISSLIIGESIKDADKQAKAQLRAQGIIAMGVGALETVKAVAAFAGFNYLEGAAHIAAAAVAFVQGGIMLSGRVPGAHGGGGGAASATPQRQERERDTSESATIPDSVPAADKRPKKAGGPGPKQEGNLTVIIQGPVIGTEEFAEDMAHRIKRAARSSEAAA